MEENGLTILIVSHNEMEYAKLALQSIRMFADVEDLSVVMIDNDSEDGFAEWAEKQEDITYVSMEEGCRPFGEILNEVCRELQIADDLLIMDPHYMLAPHALSRLRTVLYQDSRIGAVGGVSNSFSLFQKATGIEDYEDAVKWGTRECIVKEGKRILGLNPGVVYLKASAVSQLGDFDGELSDQEYVVKDYCLRMIINDWRLQVCGDALFWDVRGNGPFICGDEAQMAVMEQKWGMHYFNFTCNIGLIEFIARNRDESFNILEVGCDCGATLLEIQNRFPHAAVYGSEINAAAVNVASHIADVRVNNIEEQNLSFERLFFDYIIFGDVLEHLHDPLKTIQYCRDFLKDGGCILASVPNLMHISVMEMLLKGDFTYGETGLLDKTHIHFFTFNELIRLFGQGGYEVKSVESVIAPVSPEQKMFIDKLQEIQSDTPRYMYEAFQYNICARKKHV